MYKLFDYIPEYNIPLKKELPCLKYDLGLLAKFLKEIVPADLSETLPIYNKYLNYYSQNMNSFMPDEFPDCFRIYIIDHRFNLLFASLESKIEKLDYISYMRNQLKYPDMHIFDYTYFIRPKDIVSSVFPKEMSKTSAYNPTDLKNFINTYNFVPIETFGLPLLFTCYGEYMIEFSVISMPQVILITEKFKSKNLVDWKSITKSI